MSEQDNLALVRRGYDAFGRGDLEGLLALFDDDIEWVSPGPPQLPTAGDRRGRSQVAEFFRAIDATFEMEQFSPQQFIADGDCVIVLGTDRARVRATGKIVDEHWAHVFTVRDGKVTAFREYMDTSAVAAELTAAQQRA